MNDFLHRKENIGRIMDLTSETLILFSKEGICVDVDPHTNLWFLQEKVLLGKNIIEILPNYTYHKAIIDFQIVISKKMAVVRKYRLPIRGNLYYAECKLMPFDDMILCRYTDITNRENIGLKLEQTIDEMQEIQKVAQIGKWKLDVKTQTLYYSGYVQSQNTNNEIVVPLARYIESVVSEDKNKISFWLERAIKQLYKQNISFRIKGAMGQIHYMDVRCVMRYQGIGNTIILEGIVQNVTEMHKRRNDINMLTHVIFNVGESIYGVLADGTLKFANQIFRKNHRLGIDEDVSKYKIYDLHLGFVKDEKMWQKRLSSMEDKLEMSYIDDKSPIPGRPDIWAYEIKFYKMTEDDGSYSYWSFAHDITDRLHYESEIKKYAQLIATIFENLPASIVVKDINNDLRFLYCNRNAMNTHRFSSDISDFIGKNDFDIYPLERAKAIRAEDMEIIKTNKPYHEIIQDIDRKENSVFYDKRKLKISNPRFSPMILSIEWDITQQELLRRNLLVAKKKAEESDRLKTTFLTNISHEIRTPLNAIVGFSNILINCNDRKEREDYYDIINQSTKRLLKLINEILLLSRIESGDVELSIHDIDMWNICSEIYDLAMENCPKDVKIAFEVPSENIHIYSDGPRLMQAFLLLIKTSLKFTDKGNIWFGYRDSGKYIECYVRNNGKGISNMKEDVFGLFTKYNYGNDGCGLELTICHALIQLMGGTIKAESEQGIGSEFIFSLPKDLRKKSILPHG